MFERMRAIGAAATSAADLRRAMGAFGLESDSVLGPGAAPATGDGRRSAAARRMAGAADDRGGGQRAHRGVGGVRSRFRGPPADAVTASTALPGVSATHSINGARYINGGVRSAENADLASGYGERWWCCRRSAERTGRHRNGARTRTRGRVASSRGCAGFPGADLASQVEALREQGSHVEVITPDADSLAAMGTNQMDPATRGPSARACLAQGRQEATRVALR